MSAIPSLFDVFLRAANDLCKDFDQTTLAPLLEADIVGYLYHRLLLANIAMQDIHLDTRIVGIPRYFDLVIGPVTLGSKAHKAAVSNPQLVAQIKFFPRWGFTHQQHSVHYQHVVKDDIASFKALRAKFPGCRCCELLADFHTGDLHGYLRGEDRSAQSTRIEQVCKLAAKTGVSVVWLHPESQTQTVSKWWIVE